MGETRNVRHDVALQVFGDHHGDQGLPETAETVVAWLITQRHTSCSDCSTAQMTGWPRPRHLGRRGWIGPQ